MDYLLDSHALIWWWDEPDRLSGRIRDALEPAHVKVFISAATAVELAIKVRLGKLPKMATIMSDFGEAVGAEGFRHLPVHHSHAVKAGLLPGEHRDPFDRILAAQAIMEDLVVVTRDPELAAFGCRTIW